MFFEMTQMLTARRTLACLPTILALMSILTGSNTQAAELTTHQMTGTVLLVDGPSTSPLAELGVRPGEPVSGDYVFEANAAGSISGSQVYYPGSVVRQRVSIGAFAYRSDLTSPTGTIWIESGGTPSFVVRTQSSPAGPVQLAGVFSEIALTGGAIDSIASTELSAAAPDPGDFGVARGSLLLLDDGTLIEFSIDSLVHEPEGDLDADAIPDRADNCARFWNPDQTDSNSDGLGNVCQCGDGDGDYLITANDGVSYADHLIDPTAAALSPTAIRQCPVRAATNACELDAVAIILRAAAGLNPGVGPYCEVFDEAVDNDGDGLSELEGDCDDTDPFALCEQCGNGLLTSEERCDDPGRGDSCGTNALCSADCLACHSVPTQFRVDVTRGLDASGRLFGRTAELEVELLDVAAPARLSVELDPSSGGAVLFRLPGQVRAPRSVLGFDTDGGTQNLARVELVGSVGSQLPGDTRINLYAGTVLLQQLSITVVRPDFQRVDEQLHYRVDFAAGQTAESVCELMGLEVASFSVDSQICSAFHPEAQVVTQTAGSRAVTYCDGTEAGICGSAPNSCTRCPDCNVGIGLTEDASNLYSEAFVRCTPPLPEARRIDGTDWYRVDFERGATGASVCSALGQTPLAYTSDSAVCSAFHPAAGQVQASSGSSAVAYCEGDEVGGCSNHPESCLLCPGCNLGLSLDEDGSALYREMYVSCTTTCGNGQVDLASREPCELAEAWALGHSGAGAALAGAQSPTSWSGAFQQAAQAYDTASTELAVFQSAGARGMPELLVATRTAAEQLEFASTAVGIGDYTGAGEALIAYADTLIGQAPDPQSETLLELVHQNMRGAGEALRGHSDPEILLLAQTLAEPSGAFYLEGALNALAEEEPLLRTLVGLDDPLIQADLEYLTGAPGQAAIQAFALEPVALVQSAALLTTSAYLGTSGELLLASANSMLIASIIGQFFWMDECVNEGQKKNCKVTDTRVTLGGDPDDEEKLLKFADKLPFGAAVVRGMIIVQRITNPIGVYIKCEFERCEDTACIPVTGSVFGIDYDLEWVDKEEWIQVEAPYSQTDASGDGRWLPAEIKNFAKTQLAFDRELKKALLKCKCPSS